MRWGTLTPDGQTVFTQGGSTLIEWDALTGQPRRTASPLEGRNFVAVDQDYGQVNAPDGKRVLVTEDRRGVPGPVRFSLLNLQTGAVDAVFEVKSWAAGLTWGAGQQALALADPNSALLWYWREGMPQPASIPGGKDWNFARAGFSPDNAVMYLLNADLAAYDTLSGRELWRLPAGDVPGRNGQPLKMWRKEFGEPLLSSSPFGPRLLVRTPDGLALLNTESRALLGYLDAKFDRVQRVTWSPDGGRVLVAVDGYVHVVDANTGRPLGVVDGERALSSPNAETVWTQTYAHFVRFDVRRGLDTESVKGKTVWNSPVQVDGAGRPVRWLGKDEVGVAVFTPKDRTALTEHFTMLARYSPDGKQIATLGHDELWWLDAQTHEKKWSVGVVNTFDFAFSPDGRFLAVGGRNTRLLDAQTGKLVNILEPTAQQRNQGGRKWQPGPRGLNRSMAFSPDGKQLAVGYEASTVGVWDVARGKLTRTLTGGRGWVLSLAFSPDGSKLVSGWGDGSLHFYDARSGQESAVRQVNQGFVRWVAFSPDGGHVAAASGDGSVSLWTAAGQPVRRLTDHNGSVTSVAYLDSRTLVSADSSGTLRVWNTTDGKLLEQTEKTGALVQSLVTSGSGANMRVLSSDRDNTLRIYAR